MRLKDLAKCNHQNDGTRTLLESVLVSEVGAALQSWKKTGAGVLIGGLALSFYVKPRTTTDCDFLFLAASDIPDDIEGFKRTRKGAFQHNKTHVEIEVLIPSSINMEPELAKKIVDTAIHIDGFRVASRSGLVASKLGRFSLQDRADISALYKSGEVDLSDFPLDEKRKKNLITAQSEIED